jgi:Bax protein
MKQSKILGLVFLAYAFGTLVLTYNLHAHAQAFAQTNPDNSPTAATKTQTAPDFKSISDITQRKKSFFTYLLPSIHKQNRSLEQQRQQLLTTQKDMKQKKPVDMAKLASLSKYYKVKKTDPQSMLSELLNKVDEIPTSLVLAQAANESAWGTSRFATQANNYFGQWCFTKGCGLVPNQRKQEAKHEVKAFDSADDSVAGYFYNINSNHNYQTLRDIRADLRRDQKALDGVAMAEGLMRYSSRGEHYIKELQSMITYNRLYEYTNQ